MCKRTLHAAFFSLLLSCGAAAQVLSFPSSAGNRFGSATSMDAIQASRMDFNVFTINSSSSSLTPLQTASGSVSALDLKAPGKARREYSKGYQLLMRKDLPGAVEHLSRAVQIYPPYVAAHNALGSAYLALGKNEEARQQFVKSAALDEHLPTSLLNLGCAELALKEYPEAEESFRKASALAPLDLQLLTALAYGQYVNHDYPAVLDTAAKVHSVKRHESAAVVHYFAAAAWESMGKLPDAEDEMETLLREDRNSPSIAQFKQILEEIKQEQLRLAMRNCILRRVSRLR